MALETQINRSPLEGPFEAVPPLSVSHDRRNPSRAACLRILSVVVPVAMAVGALFVILVAAGLGRAMDAVPAFAAAGMMALYALLQALVGALLRRARHARKPDAFGRAP